MHKPEQSTIPPVPRKGRGAVSNPDGRYEALTRTKEDDGWFIEEAQETLATTLTPDRTRNIIAHNESPDVPFDQSINPYRGCEHGCVYCYARPTHAYLGLSPGLDFETRIFYKTDVKEALRKELSRRGYHCSPIALGANTDPYQPIERKLKITRQILEVLNELNHPLQVITKSALVGRDIDILASMAQRNLVQVMVSVTTLDSSMSRYLEPRATAPLRRVEALRGLSRVGIPTGVLIAPVIPVITEPEIEKVLKLCHEAGAESAGYVVLRLPREVKELFQEWLDHHEPLKAKKVMSIVKQMHGGKDYDSSFGQRMRGKGAIADLIAQRFDLACRRLGLNRNYRELDCSLFMLPSHAGDQLELF